MQIQYLKVMVLAFLLAPWIALGAVQVDLPDTAGVRGSVIAIPVYILDDLSGLGASAYQLQINYSNTLLEFQSAEKAGTLTGSLSNFEFNQTAPNQITLVAAGSSPLAGAGILIKLLFFMKSAGTASLTFTDTQHNFFNQGEPEMILLNGRVVIGNPPAITVSPNSAVIGPAGQVSFSVSGGQAPYSWSLSNPAIAEIVSTGNNTAGLTATSSGLTRVIAEDNAGIRDTTDGFVEIRPLALSIPDTFVLQGQTLDIPVRTSTMTGLTITSGSFRLIYDANRLSVLTVLKAGTLISGYDNMSYHIQPGKVDIAFAGEAPLSGAGDLIRIRVQAPLTNYGNTTISVNNAVFNQDIPATVRNGNCNVQRLPQITLSPATATLLTGETLQFSTAGTITPPLIWESSNPPVASIDGAGSLTALSSGITKITVTDAIGATAASGDIRVYDTRISLPDTTGIIGGLIDIPVKINPVPETVPIFAIQGVFSFNTTTLSFMDIFTDAAGLENWGVTVNQKGNDLHFAAAGATPVLAGGSLFSLRFRILVGATVGQKQNLQIKELLLNEGNPAALTQNGSVTAQLSGPPATPELVRPGNGNLDVPPFGAEFCWHTTLGAQRYNMQIARNAIFDEIIFDFTNITDTCFVVDSLGAEQSYFWRVQGVNNLGQSAWSLIWQFTTTINGLEPIAPFYHPDGFELHQNYPNPFNPETVIEFSVPVAGQTTLRIYNALGEMIDQPVSRPLGAGAYRVVWDAENRSSGIYYYRLYSGNQVATRRMLLVK